MARPDILFFDVKELQITDESITSTIPVVNVSKVSQESKTYDISELISSTDNSWKIYGIPQFHKVESRYTSDFTASVNIELNEESDEMKIVISHLNLAYANSFSEKEISQMAKKGQSFEKYWRQISGGVTLQRKDVKYEPAWDYTHPEWSAQVDVTINNEEYTLILAGFED